MSIRIDKIDFEKGNGLVPAIVQDAITRRVLMLGYLNEEALRKTIDEGRVTFFSRTRKELWTKGETSGNFLRVKEIRLDCDRDTLLILADPDGPVCHTGTDTCFNQGNRPTDLSFLDRLSDVIESRKDQNADSSYTASLFEKGVRRMAQKVGEEAVEVAIAAVSNDDENLMEEASDLVFHLMVLLAAKGLSLSDIAARLAARHKG